MSGGGRKSEVGYGRPLKHSQWREGQCGNPRRVYKRKPDGTVAIIDAQFAKQINIAQNGEQRRMTVFLIKKLIIEALKGDVGSAGQLLTLRAHAIKHGDSGPMIIRVTGGLLRDHSDEE